MTTEGDRCAGCATETAREPGDGGLCGACREALHPSVEDARGSKWSPAKLGFFSLVCDVMLVPSILAVVRAWRELGEVAKREEAGIWRAEHARVRTGAVLAFLTGGLRPLILFGAFLLGAAAPAPERRATPVGDELAEVLERAQGQDALAQQLAYEHLAQMAATGALTTEQRRQLLALAEGRDRQNDPLASVIAISLARTGFVTERRLTGLYPRLTRGGKERLLAYFLQSARGLETALGLLENDASDLRVHVDGPRLRELGGHAHVYLPVLFRLPDEHASHAVGRSVARSLCAEGPDPAAFTSIEASLMFDWAVARARLTDAESVLEATRALQVLGCVPSDAAGHLLEEASGHDDPRVAAAAVDALLRRGDRVPASTIARLAERPESRWQLFAALARENARDRMPAAHRGSAALAEARCAWRAFRVGGVCTPLATLRRDFDREPFDVHVFTVAGGGRAGERVGMGPFADGRPVRVITLWDEGAGTEPDELADELVARWEGRR